MFDVQILENEMVFFKSLLGKEEGGLDGLVEGDDDGLVEGELEGKVEGSDVGLEPQSLQEHS